MKKIKQTLLRTMRIKKIDYIGGKYFSPVFLELSLKSEGDIYLLSIIQLGIIYFKKDGDRFITDIVHFEKNVPDNRICREYYVSEELPEKVVTEDYEFNVSEENFESIEDFKESIEHHTEIENHEGFLSQLRLVTGTEAIQLFKIMLRNFKAIHDIKE